MGYRLGIIYNVNYLINQVNLHILHYFLIQIKLGQVILHKYSTLLVYTYQALVLDAK